MSYRAIRYSCGVTFSAEQKNHCNWWTKISKVGFNLHEMKTFTQRCKSNDHQFRSTAKWLAGHWTDTGPPFMQSQMQGSLTLLSKTSVIRDICKVAHRRKKPTGCSLEVGFTNTQKQSPLLPPSESCRTHLVPPHLLLTTPSFPWF